MSNEFSQTVNLKEKVKKQKQSSALENIYKENNETQLKFEKPQIRSGKRPRIFAFLLIIILLIFAAYWIFFRENKTPTLKLSGWYAIKLVNGETYYGQIQDIAADPVIVKNVYYDYDQAKGVKKDESESGNLRLVKRGNETHGPAGTMDLVRSQVLFMEQLKPESKVLKAILDYEK